MRNQCYPIDGLKLIIQLTIVVVVYHVVIGVVEMLSAEHLLVLFMGCFLFCFFKRNIINRRVYPFLLFIHIQVITLDDLILLAILLRISPRSHLIE